MTLLALVPENNICDACKRRLGPLTIAEVNVLVTGGAGFIGSHLVDRLLGEGHAVTTVDNFDPFYEVADKEANIAAHRQSPCFQLVRADIRDVTALRSALPGGFDAIVHLAAKAGVRSSIADPVGYERANVGGTQNLLEFAREQGIHQFVFGSSSSVYGVNPDVPWREDSGVLRPISPYAATKVAGELLGHVYSHLHGIRFLALRFFTVYGPRQRPDLAIHKFTQRILAGQPVPVFGDGSTSRDYTYVVDIVEGIRSALNYSGSAYEVINLGSDHPVTLTHLLKNLETVLQRRAVLDPQPAQPGDVAHTWADVSKATQLLNYRPSTRLADGLRSFAEWLATVPRQSRSTL